MDYADAMTSAVFVWLLAGAAYGLGRLAVRLGRAALEEDAEDGADAEH